MEEEINYEDDFEPIEFKENKYKFDGLYNECYIRLESDDVKDIKKALNEIYKQ